MQILIMPPSATRRSRALGIGLSLLLALVVSACGLAAAPSPSPSPLPSPSPSPQPSPSPSAAPSASADPVAEMAIAPPYSLEPIDPFMETTMRSQFGAAVGSFGSLISFGGRQVVKDAAFSGFLFAMGFPADIAAMVDEQWDDFLAGIQTSVGTELTKKAVDGTDVYFGTTADGSLAIFTIDGKVLFLVALQPDELEDMAAALIAANG